jgi:hypothetical protein
MRLYIKHIRIVAFAFCILTSPGFFEREAPDMSQFCVNARTSKSKFLPGVVARIHERVI